MKKLRSLTVLKRGRGEASAMRRGAVATSHIGQKSPNTERERVVEAPLLSSQAYALMKKDIVQCRLKPGEEVSEAALTSHYGFGKAPIRAALLMLSRDGLINSIPRRGYVIAPITVKDVHELFELRTILEPAAAEKAVAYLDINQLRSLCKRLRYSPNPAEHLEYIEAHHDFHVAIARASGNERLARLISTLLHDMARLVHFGEFAPGRDIRELDHDRGIQIQQHEAIVEALASGDRDIIRTVMREHIEHSLSMVKEAVFANKTLVRL